jgi:hypothetical protein
VFSGLTIETLIFFNHRSVGCADDYYTLFRDWSFLLRALWGNLNGFRAKAAEVPAGRGEDCNKALGDALHVRVQAEHRGQDAEELLQRAEPELAGVRAGRGGAPLTPPFRVCSVGYRAG